MRDLNFFSQHIKQRRSARRKSIIVISLIVSVVLIISGSYAATQYFAFKIKMDTAEMKAYISSREIAGKWKAIREQKRKLDVMNGYFTAVKTVKADIDSVNAVGSSLLMEMSKALPKGVVLNSLSLTSDVLTLQGAADSRRATAELLHNLDSLGIFNSVFASGINKAESDLESYTFDIRCLIKEAGTE